MNYYIELLLSHQHIRDNVNRIEEIFVTLDSHHVRS